MNCITNNNYDNWSENKNNFTISQEIATVYLLSTTCMLFGDFSTLENAKFVKISLVDFFDSQGSFIWHYRCISTINTSIKTMPKISILLEY